jgi:D-alanyl-D-alanine carboxypeptidase
MRKAVVAVTALVIAAGAGGEAARAASWSQAKARRATELAQHFLKPDTTPPRAPAMSLAIGLDGRLLLAEGIGEERPGHAASAGTIYRIGSLTKQFTAAATLRMIESEAVTPRTGAPVRLDTEITDVFDGVQNWKAEGQNPITLRSLLNMTSNLPNFTRKPPAEVNPWGAVEAATLFHELTKLQPSGWPSTFEYSNTSYFLLAELLETVRWPHQGHRAYEEILRSEVFNVVGMNETGFAGEKTLSGRPAAPTYHRRPAFADRDWLKGSGDVVSTATDIFKWNAALLGGKVLSPAMRKQMFAEGGRVSPTLYYGMGWFIEETDGWTRYFHSGSVPGYTAFNTIARRKSDNTWVSVTLLTNADGVEGLDNLAADLLYLVSTD